MIQYDYDGETYHLDLDDVSTQQLVKIKATYGLNLKDLNDGMRNGDIDAIRCLHWIAIQQGGNDRVRLETVQVEKPAKLASALMAAGLIELQKLIAEAEDAIAAGKVDGPKA